MDNIYKGLGWASLIIVVALVAKAAGVDKTVSFGIVTVISGFAALAIARSPKPCERKGKS
jgi:hypothetical protein